MLYISMSLYGLGIKNVINSIMLLNSPPPVKKEMHLLVLNVHLKSIRHFKSIFCLKKKLLADNILQIIFLLLSFKVF